MAVGTAAGTLMLAAGRAGGAVGAARSGDAVTATEVKDAGARATDDASTDDGVVDDGTGNALDKWSGVEVDGDGAVVQASPAYECGAVRQAVASPDGEYTYLVNVRPAGSGTAT